LEVFFPKRPQLGQNGLVIDTSEQSLTHVPDVLLDLMVHCMLHSGEAGHMDKHGGMLICLPALTSDGASQEECVDRLRK
jgi:hypothetical protein